jgi:ornithine decarboxylase
MNAHVLPKTLAGSHPIDAAPRRTPALSEVMRDRAIVSPTFCLSPRSVLAGLAAFQNGFPGETTFAVKACPLPRLIGLFATAGMTAFDVASLEEMALVRAAAPMAELHYHNPIRSDAETATALSTFGVRHFSVDDAHGLARLAVIADRLGVDKARIEIAIRLKPTRNAALQDFRSKFGATRPEAEALLGQATSFGFRVSLTGHPGSQCLDPQAYVDFIDEASAIAAGIGGGLVSLNLGGGFPVAYPGVEMPEAKHYFDAIRQRFTAAFAGEPTRLVAEPGRALAAHGLSLLAPVKHVRPGGDVFLEDGIYGALMELLVMPMSLPMRVWRGGEIMAGATRPARLFGPTCDPIDVLPGRYDVPADLVEGDVIELGLIGGYGPSTVTRFNGYGAIALIEADGILGGL